MTAHQRRLPPSKPSPAELRRQADAAVAKGLADVRAQLAALRSQRVELEASAVATKAILDAGAARAAAATPPTQPAVAAPVAQPVSELDALAEAMVVKAAYGISREQARARVLKANPRLYNEAMGAHWSRNAPRRGTTFDLLRLAREARS